MDEPDNLVLVFLRRMDAKLDRLNDDMHDLKTRVTSLEVAVGNLAASELSHYASTAQRADRFDQRLERIEKRLDLKEA